MKWNVLYYEPKGGKSEVCEFINKRKEKEKGKILAFVADLEEKGPQLPRPYADILEDGIHELRIRLKGDLFRVMYFFCFRNFIVFTNCFAKNTQKVPLSEIEKAKKCRTDFFQRFTEDSLRRITNENI